MRSRHHPHGREVRGRRGHISGSEAGAEPPHRCDLSDPGPHLQTQFSTSRRDSPTPLSTKVSSTV